MPSRFILNFDLITKQWNHLDLRGFLKIVHGINIRNRSDLGRRRRDIYIYIYILLIKIIRISCTYSNFMLF